MRSGISHRAAIAGSGNITNGWLVHGFVKTVGLSYRRINIGHVHIGWLNIINTGLVDRLAYHVIAVVTAIGTAVLVINGNIVRTPVLTATGGHIAGIVVPPSRYVINIWPSQNTSVGCHCRLYVRTDWSD